MPHISSACWFARGAALHCRPCIFDRASSAWHCGFFSSFPGSQPLTLIWGSEGLSSGWAAQSPSEHARRLAAHGPSLLLAISSDRSVCRRLARRAAGRQHATLAASDGLGDHSAGPAAARRRRGDGTGQWSFVSQIRSSIPVPAAMAGETAAARTHTTPPGACACWAFGPAFHAGRSGQCVQRAEPRRGTHAHSLLCAVGSGVWACHPCWGLSRLPASGTVFSAFNFGGQPVTFSIHVAG